MAVASCGGETAAGRAGWLAGLLPQPAMSSAVSHRSRRGAAPSAAHQDFITCSAALASSSANDDTELVVPGPGSKFSSARVRPLASMT